MLVDGFSVASLVLLFCCSRFICTHNPIYGNALNVQNVIIIKTDWLIDWISEQLSNFVQEIYRKSSNAMRVDERYIKILSHIMGLWQRCILSLIVAYSQFASVIWLAFLSSKVLLLTSCLMSFPSYESFNFRTKGLPLSSLHYAFVRKPHSKKSLFPKWIRFPPANWTLVAKVSNFSQN